MSSPPEHDLQRLLAEEPFVRELAQQLVVGDADEVVQQTWLRAVQQGGRGVERPRHWLARIVRNVVANLRRDDRRRRDRHLGAAAEDLVPSSAALVEREERRRALVAAVDALPPPLRTVVLLRWFEGQPPRRIAKALGVPAATVSTQLQRALALLRQRLDAAHGGDRRAWLVPLVPFVVRPDLPLAPPILPVPAAAAPAMFLGAIAMTTKSKLVVSAAVLLAAASAWVLWFANGVPAPTPPVAAVAAPADPVHAPLGETARVAPTAEAGATRELAVTPAAPATTGTLIVHVRYGDDHAPAAGTMLLLRRRGCDPRYESWRQRTDETGTSRYDGVPPGRWYVSDDLGPGKRVDAAAGQTTEIDLDLQIGITVTGIVVDDNKVPVAGARVEVTMMARSDSFPDVVAVTGADGRFAARACPDTCLVGARAFGHSASAVKFLHGKDGNEAQVELVLGPDGGAVDGTVVDRAGKAIADATVIVGKGELSGIPGRDHIPPFPALARGDAQGRFVAIGVPAGDQPLEVRAPGFAPWQGQCAVVSGTTVTQRIVLDTGGVIRGSVRNAEGKAVDRAEVEIGRWQDLAHYQTITAADGAFELAGLPLGDLQVRASHDDFGKAEQRVTTTPEASAAIELKLTRGLELKGRVVDGDGQPVAGVALECMGEQATGNWFAFVVADAQGRFAAANCPETGTISITIRSRGFEELRQRGIDPKTPDLQLQVRRQAPATVRITARVVGPDGHAVANASVSGLVPGQNTAGMQATDNDGRFELGPVPPGTWRVYVFSPNFPEFLSEPRELAANANWDLGTITLARGGTARVRLLGPRIEGATFFAVDAARTRSWSVGAEGDGYRTTVLAPGDHLLLVTGKGVAAASVPFTIRAGEEVPIDVQVQPGIPQRFACELPPGAKVDSVTLRVQRGEAFVGRAGARSQAGEPVGEMWLAAGDYTVFAEAGALRGSATFSVGAASGPPVRVTLR